MTAQNGMEHNQEQQTTMRKIRSRINYVALESQEGAWGEPVGNWNINRILWRRPSPRQLHEISLTTLDKHPTKACTSL